MQRGTLIPCHFNLCCWELLERNFQPFKPYCMRGTKKLITIFLLSPFSLLAAVKGGTEINDQKGAIASINGFVTEAGSKKPVAGVTISISGVSDRQDKKDFFVTDASGNFSVPARVSGGVTIVLEKKGYKTVRRDGIIIKEGETLKLNLDLDPAGPADEVFHPLLRMMDGM